MASEPPGKSQHGILTHRFMASQQWDRALATALEWLGREPENTHAHEAAAQSLINLNHATEAEKHMAKVLAAWPNDAFSHRLMAIIQMANRKFKPADESIRRAISLSPNDAYNWFQLAHQSFQQNDFVTAVKSIQRARELKPNDADILNLAILCGLFGSGGKNVIEEYERALALDPENASLYNNMGGYWLVDGKDYAKAEECFRRALFFEPSSKGFRKNLFVAIKHRDLVYRILNIPRDLLLEARTFYARINILAKILLLPLWLIKLPVLLAGTLLWFWFVWPIKKVYEYLTIGDILARAGEIGDSRGGFLGYRKWSLHVRLSLFGLLLVMFWGGTIWFISGGDSSNPEDRLGILIALVLTMAVIGPVFFLVRKISKPAERNQNPRNRERQMDRLFDSSDSGKA